MILVATTLPGPGQSQNGPQVFAPGVISTGHEAAITFKRDGKILYFARRVDRKHPAHIYRSRLVAGVWQTPEVVLLGGDAWFEFDPCISPDGKHLFFASNRPAKGTNRRERMFPAHQLRSLPFETAIIERYRRRDPSVEEALVEMDLAGVSVRRVEDITQALWGMGVGRRPDWCLPMDEAS